MPQSPHLDVAAGLDPDRLRRRYLAAAALAPLWPGLAAARGTVNPTPAQTEGPFYPVDIIRGDTDFDLLHRAGQAPYAAGRPTWLLGSVMDTDGRPVAGAQVEIWQCDQQGHYHHPRDGAAADPRFQGFGRVTVAADGAYRFRTIRPAPYSGRTPHIHLKVRLGARELLTTQLYVAGDPGNARDGLWRALSAPQRDALTRPFEAGADGLVARFPIVVQA